MSLKESEIESEIIKCVADNELSCSDAFEIAWKLQIPACDIGAAADRLNLKLAKCQLGLFGYKPDKKIVKVNDFVPEDLEAAIRNCLDDGKLLCIKSWEIADNLNLSRFSVSCACEALGIKIKDCQIGAF
ncbi:MAG: hypothetical protein FP814_13360 [Desulfobacterium sp.]|nr:hypothetical protein [Desulfobacterium sp.]MBU3947834.1 hypothetical protein [Pseudomonadota bacterium]